MKTCSRSLLTLLIVMTSMWTVSGSASAQHDHSDVILGYDNSASPAFIEIEGTPSSGGILLFDTEFNQLLYDTTQPGFSTEAAEGLEITFGHRLFLQVVNASTAIQGGAGLGYVNYFNPNNDSILAVGKTDIESEVDSTAYALDGASFTGGPVLIDISASGKSDPGGIHEHVHFTLTDLADADQGAYGVLFSLFTQDENGSFVAASDDFWIVFNNGMDDVEFESRAVAAFGNFSAVPEPSSGLLLCGVALAAFAGRRRRR